MHIKTHGSIIETVQSIPYAGITRIRLLGMISARNIKAPHEQRKDNGFYGAIKGAKMITINLPI